MKYAVLSVINGNFNVEAEFGDNLKGALVFFHSKCETLWNAEDVQSAKVEIVDQNLSVVDSKSETIVHPIVEPEE